MRYHLQLIRSATMVIAGGLMLCASGCTSNNSQSTAPASLSFSFGSAGVVVAQDGYPATLPIIVNGPSGTETVTASGLPLGVTEQFTAVNGGP